MIIGKDIVKKYGNTIVLNGMNVDLAPNKITVLIGQSGSGKTTLLKAMSLLEKPDSGTIEIDETKYTFPNSNGRIRNQFKYDGSQTIGVVFQDLNLIPHWTNRQNITKVVSELDEFQSQKFEELASIFKLDGFLDKYPSQCSRGEQQRIAFVRAVMLNPKYLMLDEITSALDPELVAILFKYLLKLRDSGVGIFLITHFLLFAQNVADKVVFIDKGEVVEQGDREIMTTPNTNQLKYFLDSLDGIIIQGNV